jgi:hypothetical protein
MRNFCGPEIFKELRNWLLVLGEGVLFLTDDLLKAVEAVLEKVDTIFFCTSTIWVSKHGVSLSHIKSSWSIRWLRLLCF